TLLAGFRPAAVPAPASGPPIHQLRRSHGEPQPGWIHAVSGQLLAGPQGAFYLACALALLTLAVIVVVHKPVVGLWALAVVFATEDATPIPLDTSLLRAGSTHVYPADVLSIVLLLATAVFAIRRPPP